MLNLIKDKLLVTDKPLFDDGEPDAELLNKCIENSPEVKKFLRDHARTERKTKECEGMSDVDLNKYINVHDKLLSLHDKVVQPSIAVVATGVTYAINNSNLTKRNKATLSIGSAFLLSLVNVGFKRISNSTYLQESCNIANAVKRRRLFNNTK